MTDKTPRAAMRTLTALLLALAVMLVASPAALAEEGGGYPSANINVHNQASLQRGARLFMNYCVGCHSLKYMRYSQMADGLGLTEKQVMDNLNFTGAKFGEPIVSAMPEAEAEKWFGKVARPVAGSQRQGRELGCGVSQGVLPRPRDQQRLEQHGLPR